MTGFEARQLAADKITSQTGTTATLDYSTAQARTGAASFRIHPASGVAGFLTFPATSGYFHFSLYVAALPSVDRVIWGSTAAGTANIRLTNTGNLAYYIATTLLGTTNTTPFAATGWHWVGIYDWGGFGLSDLLVVDGAVLINADPDSQLTVSTTVIGCSGTEATACDIYIDDVIVDSTNLLAPSKVDIALPISDNTVTGVTTNAGGTTNLWDCVNNTPPAGVASASEAAAGAVSIKYPASATENYIANLETYTTLGIGGFDTILAVQPLVRHGEDSATGTKNLQNVGALTNPTYGGASAVAGLDGGAHGAESGANFWTVTSGFLASPSVTLNQSPTIQTSRISEARVACIDFMGMMVAWTPTRVPKTSPYPQLLAQ